MLEQGIWRPTRPPPLLGLELAQLPAWPMRARLQRAVDTHSALVRSLRRRLARERAMDIYSICSGG